MKKIHTLLLVLTLFSLACNQAQKQAELAKLEAVKAMQLAEEAQQALEEANKVHKRGNLMHIVTIPVRADLSEEDKAFLIKELQSLQEVAGVVQLHVGSKVDTGDARMAEGNWLVLSVVFEGTEQLASYQQDAFHLAVRERTVKYLAGPPTVYDYTIQ